MENCACMSFSMIELGCSWIIQLHHSCKGLLCPIVSMKPQHLWASILLKSSLEARHTSKNSKTSPLHPKKESLWKHLSMSLISLCMKTWVLAVTTLDKDHSYLNLNNKFASNNILQSLVCYIYQLS